MDEIQQEEATSPLRDLINDKVQTPQRLLDNEAIVTQQTVERCSSPVSVVCRNSDHEEDLS
jgi:hypothetical protein